MTLTEAIDEFIEYRKIHVTPGDIVHDSCIQSLALELLKRYFASSDAQTIECITSDSARDFLSRWFVEEIARINESDSQLLLSSQRDDRIQHFLITLSEFFEWITPRQINAADYLPIIEELKTSLPQAIRITLSLSGYLAKRGGPFGFPEFLTSFEDGGQSEYDIGKGGESLALEGYFQILRVDGLQVEAVEIISEERIWPIIFPDDIAPLLVPDYIINLEIIRTDDGWHIAGSGLAYPPGAALF